MAHSNEKDSYNAKPPVFDGEKFDYWKDRIESFFLGYDADLWDIVTDGYKPPTLNGAEVPRSKMSEDQKREFKNHHKARTILLNAISYNEYEKITNRETAKDILDSLKMTHEGNSQVKETKALALIQKYEAFKMEDDEAIEAMFSRFQTLIAGLKVLDKGYTTADHVKKIVRSLPKKWRPMVTALKLSKDLNNISLEELVSSLRSHEIELEEDEPQKRNKSVALKSRPERRKSDRTKALQAETADTDDSEPEDSDDEEELSLLTRRVKQLWKRRNNNNFRRSRPRRDRAESTSKGKPNKDITCFECKETGHYRNECPKLKKDNPRKESFKKNTFRTKKGLMATWDDSESGSSESDSDEQANVAFMATTSSSSDEESEEVFSELSRSDLESCLSETLTSLQKLKQKVKDIKGLLKAKSEVCSRLETTILARDDTIRSLTIERDGAKTKSLELEETLSQAPQTSNEIIYKYEEAFQQFLKNGINRSIMASMIYGVGQNNKRGIGYDSDSDKTSTSNQLKSPFSYHYTHTQEQKFKNARRPKVIRNSGKTNLKGPKRFWVPKDKIIYVADILCSKVQTPVMVPGLWMLATYDGKKVYVPKPGT